ncbi:PHP domain-containing protein [Anaerocolumna aminovalerica]|uniref:PHP domain-containing protein n=1 Tax=Anaerocolumna aminovalerica TaxID=1527 RepID=UPI000BE33D17|nr:PHP domain-containing protein [Anaerocolumna aminovalerica]
MINLAYDFHLHSCLSPCGDNDMTPANIIAMARLKNLDVVALTDHNSSKNCPAFLSMAKKQGIIAIPGMELCTQEEVHVLCLFSRLEDAMNFDSYVYEHLIPITNNQIIFGKQQIYNEEDKAVGEEPYLLINATDISFEEVYDLVKDYNGIMIPAHIDRMANSLLYNLGFIPSESKFSCVELYDRDKMEQLRKENPYLNNCKIITNSDAHYLEHINEPVNYIQSESRDIKDILKALEG